MTRWFYFFMLLFVSGMLAAQTSDESQSIYKTSTLGDAIAMGSGLGLAVTGHLLGRKQVKFNPADFAALDPMEINGFDRPATMNWSPAAARMSDVTLLGSGILGLSMMLGDGEIRQEWKSWSVMALEVFFVTHGTTFLTKNITDRLRPFAYNQTVPVSDKEDKDIFQSFFSGHSSFAAAASFYTAKLYHDCHPDSKWRLAVWGGAGLLSGTTAWLRVRAGKHFPTDVITGVAAGALIGVLVPEIHRRKRSPADASTVKFEFGPAWGVNGLRVGMRF